MSQFHYCSGGPRVAQTRIDPMGSVFCMWDLDGTHQGLHCGQFFLANNLSTHLREEHNIHGADKMPVWCRWEGCGKPMNKESLARHIEEKHLRIGYPCDTCGRSFSRSDTLKKHKGKCPGS